MRIANELPNVTSLFKVLPTSAVSKTARSRSFACETSPSVGRQLSTFVHASSPPRRPAAPPTFSAVNLPWVERHHSRQFVDAF
jgi:hypothetical protein